MSSWKKIKEKITKVLRTPMFYGAVIFVVLSLFFTRQILNNNGIGDFVVIATIEVAVELIIMFVVCRMWRRGEPLEKQFLFAALLLGGLFIIIMPPGQAPDEITHFRRAYGVSQGILIANQEVNDKGAIGSLIPKNSEVLNRAPAHGSYELITEEIVREDDELSAQPYTSAALYNFICYIPQALAAFIGRMLGFSIMGIAYLMSIFNFAVWLVLSYLAIKLIPKFKPVALFISLLPTTLQEATSVAPDALTIGLSLFLVSYVLYLAYGKVATLAKKDYVILTASALVIGFCKIVYLPLILLMMMIPVEKFGSKKRKWWFLGILFGVVALVNLVWLVISSRYLVEYRPGVDSKAQLMGILSNPLKYLMVMFRTINTSGQGWMANMLGTTLGSFKFYLPHALFLVSFAVMVMLFAQRDENLKLRKIDRAVVIFVFFAIAVLIFTSLYMQWTAYGAEVIDGIQGRYFIPILLLIPIAISRVKDTKKVTTLISERAVLGYGVFLNIVTLVCIFAQNA